MYEINLVCKNNDCSDHRFFYEGNNLYKCVSCDTVQHITQMPNQAFTTQGD